MLKKSIKFYLLSAFIIISFILSSCSQPDILTVKEDSKIEKEFDLSLTVPVEDVKALEEIESQIAKEFSLSSYPDINYPRAINVNPTTTEILNEMKTIGVKYNIPCEVLYAIGLTESNLKQFKSDGTPLISGDGGIGIMQVTPYAVSIPFDENKLKYDYKYNIEAGAQVILGKWKYILGRNPIGNMDAKVLENWFLAIWAYNGYSYINNPNEYIYGPRTWSNSSISWTATAAYETNVLAKIKSSFGITITPLAGSVLPAYGSRPGIPASGQKFSTPTPIHYTSNSTTVTTTTTTTTIQVFEKPFYRTLKQTSPLMQGKDVMLFQLMYNNWAQSNGYSTITADGYYGSASYNASVTFQNYYKAELGVADGIAGINTIKKLVNIFVNINSYYSPWNRTLKVTSPLMYGDDIKTFQSKYNIWASKNGKSNITVDGYYGTGSYNASINFQNTEKTLLGTADGIAGQKTTRLLFVRTYF
ncbi:MAG: hypothetical protein A2Y34_10825 [Spirochaetes bacterium GWC1_27_15]|nr:MAG: hypothetical protein A2Z98_09615 [Spirochaetes bacterium GWB1_27_13]OHD22313.1 MAG: hypothetical protein A2Y34_10825 [Spirochaetes bacterium GWC1_27_15]